MSAQEHKDDLVVALSTPGNADCRSKRRIVRQYLPAIILAHEEDGKSWEEISDDIWNTKSIRIKPTTLACYVSRLRSPRKAAPLATRTASGTAPAAPAPNQPTANAAARAAPSETQVKGEIRAITPRRPS